MENGLSKLFWGFIFVLLSFRIQGFDILPDIVGYILFAIGFSSLAAYSSYFSTASKYNVAMIVLSVFSIYQGQGSFLGIISIPLGIAAFILNLLVVYNLFMGIKDIAGERQHYDLSSEADTRWNQYKILQIAAVCSFILIFIPPLAFIYIIAIFIASIIIAVKILGFIKRCSENLAE